MTKVTLAISSVTLALVVVFVVGFANRKAEIQPIDAPVRHAAESALLPRSVESQDLHSALGIEQSDMVEVGGIERPKRDLLDTKIDLVAAREEYLASMPKTGFAPAVKNDANPTVEVLSKELNANKGLHASKSPFVSPEPFNLASYQKDIGAYLSLTRPGRVFQAATPSENTLPLVSNSFSFQEILQGDSVLLEAKADPGMPVTFHTQQLGEFDNRLKTITVAASKEGIARVKYKAVSGVKGLVRILAASPVHSGQLKYVVKVNLPN